MRSKSALLALLCLLLLVSASLSARAATTLSPGTDYFMTVSSYASGEQSGLTPNYYVGLTTLTIYADNGGTQGALLDTYQGFCIDFFDKISTPTTYLVEAQGVGPNYNAAYDPALSSAYKSGDTGWATNSDETPSKLAADAILGAEFNGVDANDAAIQEEIWDEGGASISLTTAELNNAVAAQAAGASIGANNDIAFYSINGDGQSFMADLPATTTTTPPVGTVPEPSSLFLLGTGVLACAATLRRRIMVKA